MPKIDLGSDIMIAELDSPPAASAVKILILARKSLDLVRISPLVFLARGRREVAERLPRGCRGYARQGVFKVEPQPKVDNLAPNRAISPDRARDVTFVLENRVNPI